MIDPTTLAHALDARLMATLQDGAHLHGAPKLAFAIRESAGEYVPRDESLREHVLAVTIKMGQDRLADAAIRDGLAALARVRKG